MDDLISRLSEIRSKYNCFDENEEPYYRALSETIRVLSQRADGDTISRAEAIDEMREMYHAAEKWLQEAEDDTIKARAESCMATLVEMKLRAEKLPSAEPTVRIDGSTLFIEIDDVEPILRVAVIEKGSVWGKVFYEVEDDE